MYQQTIIIGNLGSDPELRFTGDGTAVASFSVATNRRWNNADGSKGEETTWFRANCWRRTAEIANEYLHKGDLVMLVGRVKASAFPDKNTGEARASLELTVTELKLMPKGSGSQTSGGNSGYSGSSHVDEEEIPF